MGIEPLLTGAAVLATIVAQLVAAFTALGLMKQAGRFRMAWGAISLGLVVMTARRLTDAISLSQDRPPPLTGLVIALVVSLLLAWGMRGVRELFADLEHTRARLYEEATRDELTQISNRRHVLWLARHEAERARRSNRACTLLLLDIDHFKKVNDTLGHERGDDVLRCVTKICAGELRASDPFGRIGGDEFLVVLPEQELEAAALVAERLRSAIAARCGVQGLALPLTVSIGYAPLSREELPADELVTQALSQADDALYRAKQEGRNRVARAG